ncbi:sirohydrochlorin chelatase [Bacillus dakarensis]|uniref:sirohydrochlorin chelatase n=1 Tax=Robertmurraya dakarensis TaxID=1926278 RepID=UPI0009820C8A|nr:sirohydrochlorin chelatase [Bacillus dakarensis]
MEAILYVCHGSRLQKANEEAIAFIKRCMKKNKNKITEYGFLELASPTIEEAYERCVNRGAVKIKVIPVLLLTAVHAKKDIPEALSRLREKYPSVEIRYGRPIGVHSNMIDIVTERLWEKASQISEDSFVLLVGRGSSDPSVKNDLSNIAKMLKKKIGSVLVKDCYLTGSGTSFEEAIRDAENSDAKEIYIIPYLLFTGILMTTLNKKISEISNNGNKRFILCNYLGNHPLMERILEERLSELDFKKEDKPKKTRKITS